MRKRSMYSEHFLGLKNQVDTKVHIWANHVIINDARTHSGKLRMPGMPGESSYKYNTVHYKVSVIWLYVTYLYYLKGNYQFYDLTLAKFYFCW